MNYRITYNYFLSCICKVGQADPKIHISDILLQQSYSIKLSVQDDSPQLKLPATKTGACYK